MKEHKHTPISGASDNDRRDSDRCPVIMSVKIGLLIPEISPEPQVWRAVIKNVSPRGMMLEVLGLDPETYAIFIKDQRHVVVYLPVAGQPSPMELKGKVVWLDYRPQSRPRELCSVGLLFENLNEADTQYLSALVARAAVRPDTSY